MVSVALGISDDSTDSRRIVLTHSAAQREGEQFLGQRSDEELGMFEQCVLQAGDAVEPAAVRKPAASIDGQTILRQPPAANRVEVFECETHWVH